MSYLVSAIIEKPKEGQEKVSYCLMGGFDGMEWHMAKSNKADSVTTEQYIKELNESVRRLWFNDPTGETTMEKLLTAPLDEVIVLDGDTYYSMKDRKPIDNTGRKTPYIKPEDYLKINLLM